MAERVKADTDMRIAVIGVGNVLASDDGVGIHAARQLQGLLGDPRVEVAESDRGGLDLLDLIQGHTHAVLIDAAKTGQAAPGSLKAFSMSKPFHPSALPSLHTVSLQTVLAFGTMTGFDIPAHVMVYTVEANDVETFHEGCTPEVARAVPMLVDRILTHLRTTVPDLVFSRIATQNMNSASHNTSMEFA